jgi:hypothetical protein
MEDVKEADACARIGPMADYYRARAQRCREDIEFLEKELEQIKAPFTLIQGGKSVGEP